MITKRMAENAHKIGYMVTQYPEKTLMDVVGLLQMPAIDINTAVWAAIELGIINDPDKETGTMSLNKVPKKWVFGENVDNLESTLLYSFNELSKKEQDLEENYLASWTQGYPVHDVLVAMRHLIDSGKVAEYDLTDPKDLKSTYTFYTLYDNREQMWGAKQFKEEPTGKETPEAPDEVEESKEEVSDENKSNG